MDKLECYKGFDVMIAAFAPISESIPDVDLLIEGDGRKRDT